MLQESSKFDLHGNVADMAVCLVAGAEEAPAKPPEPLAEEELLTDIRDLLKRQR